ncbi:MAG: hypothetical protein JW844_01260 [Candidatus Omnitrophica bacterium]|nr:hypothetical protein [Candidatus Omnitrophota bacterium]
MIIAVLVLFGIAHIPVTEKYGVNFTYYQRTMPLYEKAVHFISRHLLYRRLAREITLQATTPEEALEAILEWMRDNIHNGIPQGLRVCDDHIASIIIRGYGADDQIVDVFCVLSTYSGMRASMYKLPKSADGTSFRVAAIVEVDGLWRLADPNYHLIFRDERGDLMTLNTLIGDPHSIERSPSLEALPGAKEPYLMYFQYIKPVGEIKTVRAELQIPLRRLLFEIRKAFRLEDNPPLFVG